MNGIGGWMDGKRIVFADRLLATMKERIAGGRTISASTLNNNRTGLVVAGAAQAAMIYTSGMQSVGILGRPRWVADGKTEIALDRVCRLFLDEYRANGAAALCLLHGEFSLALMDQEAGQVLLAIDRYGIRNLIYQVNAEGVIFGSSCDIVRLHPGADHEIEPQAIYNYVYFHAVPGPMTIYRKQQRLMPGHFMIWSHGYQEMRPYWHMIFREQAGSVEQFKPGFRQALNDAVKRAADDTACGAFLSGGTDSSTISGLLGKVSGAPAKTYSIGFNEQGYDEMNYARIASRHFGTEHHEYYVTAQDVVDALPVIANAYDQPFGNASAVAAYYCARLAKSDGVKRMLAGDGGDELFGGNSRYATQYLLSIYHKVPAFIRSNILEPVLMSGHGPGGLPFLRKGRSYIEQASRPMPARYESYNLLNRLGAETVFTPEFLSKVDVNAPHDMMEHNFENYRSASLINQMLGIDLKVTLADSDLPKVTRMCELAGTEVAFPMLDDEVVEFSRYLPADLKLRGTRLRYFFKEALRDFLPGEIIRKQKQGFGLPVGPWLTQHRDLNAFTRECLTNLGKREIVSPIFVQRLLGEYLQTHAAYYGTMAWILLMLELWFEEHSPAAL